MKFCFRCSDWWCPHSLIFSLTFKRIPHKHSFVMCFCLVTCSIFWTATIDTFLFILLLLLFCYHTSAPIQKWLETTLFLLLLAVLTPRFSAIYGMLFMFELSRCWYKSHNNSPNLLGTWKLQLLWAISCSTSIFFVWWSCLQFSSYLCASWS